MLLRAAGLGLLWWRGQGEVSNVALHNSSSALGAFLEGRRWVPRGSLEKQWGKKQQRSCWRLLRLEALSINTSR